MHPKLKAALCDAIEAWIDDSCESQEWEETDAFFGKQLAEHMALAAAAVFDGVVESQEYAKKEKYLVEPNASISN